MAVKALLVKVPQMSNYITTINKAPEVIRGVKRDIYAVTEPATFTRVWMSSDKTSAIYVTHDFSGPNNSADTEYTAE